MVKGMEGGGGEGYVVKSGWKGSGKGMWIKDRGGIMEGMVKGWVDNGERLSVGMFKVGMGREVGGVERKIVDGGKR